MADAHRAAMTKYQRGHVGPDERWDWRDWLILGALIVIVLVGFFAIFWMFGSQHEVKESL